MGADFPWFAAAAVALVTAAVAVAVIGILQHTALRALAARGVRTEGTVVRSEYTGFGSDGQRQAPRRRETVAFTAGGREITGRPLAEDRFHEDRSEQTVTVVHDPDRPARFIAPLHGDRLSRSPLGRLLGLAFGLLLVAGLMLLLENLFSYLETVGP